MKRIIIRSLRVALVLAILCVSMELIIFKSGWFVLLLLPVIFFLDVSDSMLVWRLKRITVSRMRTPLIYLYLSITLIAVLACSYGLASAIGPIMKNPYTLGWIIYSGLIIIFAFRYFAIVVRVMARYMDRDEEF